MYKNWQKLKIPFTYLIILILIAGSGYFILNVTKQQKKVKSYELQIKAAQLMHRSMLDLKKLRFQLSIGLDKTIDPNQTGIIGKEYTPLTTTLGNLKAKRTATNPDFAALMVRYFHKLKLKKGDVIAIGASGSFPGLIIASLTAAKVMDLKAVLIYSLGSSMYGANIPGFTFLDMLEHLNKKNILPYQPIAVSLGGNKDRAISLLSEQYKENFLAIARNSGLTFIYEDSIADSIDKRMRLFEEAAGNKNIKCFINIGGAVANFGGTGASLSYPNGLVTNPPPAPGSTKRGLVFEYSVRSIPVIHLLNIRELASENGIAVDPVPLPRPGNSDVYYQIQYNKSIIILVLAIITFVVYIGYKNRKKPGS